MQIRDYQRWLQDWDAARGWNAVLLSHTLLHALEELGEVSKLAQMVEGYRTPAPGDLDEVRDLLALELSDLQVMLFKVAYLTGIDMESAMLRGMAKADARFPDESAGQSESDAVWERFADYLDRQGLRDRLSPGPSDI